MSRQYSAMGISFSLQPILYVIGILLAILGGTMLIPAAIDLVAGHSDWSVFVASAMVTIFLGVLLILTNRSRIAAINMRQGFVLTTGSWVALAGFGALPFIFSGLQMSIVDGFYESMSGLTTTGATVIVGLDNAPPGILMWRALLHGLGGIGIVVMAVLILPFLRVGGQQLFRTESSDKSEKPFPRFTQVVAAITVVYVVLILLCAAALWFAGMSGFDAIAHSLATIATGGFSTKDASLGFYNSPTIDWIEVTFMISGALPLTWYVRVVRDGKRALNSDSQVWMFLITLLICVGAMTLWVYATQPFAFGRALTLAALNVTSIVTDTGFVSADYYQWGSFAVVGFFLFNFIGGCTGSTAGSIKIFRWQVLFSSLRQLTMKSFLPNRVVPIFYNGQRVGQDESFSVFSFFLLYILTYAALVLGLSLCGVDFLSATSAVASNMANAGPGLGDIVGPAGTFKPLPDAAKWILSLAMLLGRLELFTIFVMLFPDFWRI